MSPGEYKRHVVDAKARSIVDLVETVGPLLPTSEDRLAANPVARLALERAFIQVVDLAVDINAHVVASVLGKAPEAYRSSFTLAVEAGLLGADLAEQLGRAAGLRNLLVHAYGDIDQGRLVAALNRFSDDFRDYARQVARYEPPAPRG